MSKQHLKQGFIDLAKKKYQAVHARALEMIKVDVNNAVPYCLLASIAAEHGNHIKACELFERAVKLSPNNVYYQAYYGKALTTLGHQNAAKLVADRAATLHCDDAYILDTIGVIYSRTGYHEKAIDFFEQAVKLDGEPANFYYNLAASQQFLGNFEHAETAYLSTLERDPKAHRAWSSLVGLKRQSESDNHLSRLTQLFDELACDADAALHLGHAIAKTLEDLGHYEDSLNWLHKAKKLKRASLGSASFTYQELFKAAKKLPVSARADASNPTNDAPIFIIGLPRTGTTLVDRIISSHSQVTAAGELNVFPGLIKNATKTKSNMVLDSETMLKAHEVSLPKIGQAYVHDTNSLARGAERITDKMPLNFFYAGLIHQALPNARIIVLRRGAMDSCLSNYRQLLTLQHSYYQYTYNLDDTAAFYRSFDSLMTHWREHLPSDRFMEVRYEDIVLDQENQTRRLLEFCGLDWEEACLRFHENTAPVSTASSVQVRQPLYSGSIGRWQRYGNKLDGQSSLADLADQ